MAIPIVAVVVPVGVLFFASGFIINIIQNRVYSFNAKILRFLISQWLPALCFLFVRPFSKSAFRKINRAVAELLWLELVWLMDWWAGVQIKLFTEPETLQLMGKEHALLVSNHKSDIDWLVGWVLAQRSGCLGSSLAVMKKSSLYLPVIGWSMWFSEYLFLERSWAKDEDTLNSGFQQLKDFPRPFWMGLFVEGTRFTPEKLVAAQEYAASAGLPVPRNVLIPRTKGFVSAVNNIRSFVPAIYEITAAIPKISPPPTMLRLFKGQPSVVHVHLRRHLLKDLPHTEKAISQWCKDMFVAKDKLLDKHIANDTFDGHCLDIGRSMKPLVVIIFWACLLILGGFKLLEWTSLLSSWKGIAFSAMGLAIITILMQILIQFTQSERSNPDKVLSLKHKANGEPSTRELKVE